MTAGRWGVRDWNAARTAGGKRRWEGYCFCVHPSIQTQGGAEKEEGIQPKSSQKGTDRLTERANCRLRWNHRRGWTCGDVSKCAAIMTRQFKMKPSEEDCRTAFCSVTHSSELKYRCAKCSVWILLINLPSAFCLSDLCFSKASLKDKFPNSSKLSKEIF